ncbi:hypothetical protein [Actinomadura monticuli]|uniref:Uncharacterized protein n=1 Tax=Actinomadura monticuli TaxID=3097367 RepID=A0ABV4QDP9_9ACTN
MKSFNYTELDLLAGEVLPERAVLSTLLVGGGHGDDDSTTVVQNSCVSTNNQQNAGLLSALGLNSQNPTVSHSCLPGTTAVNNG